MSKYLYCLIVVCLSLTGCDNDYEIYEASYLDKIFPNSDRQRTFIIKSNIFNRPTCSDIEKWSIANIKPILKVELEPDEYIYSRSYVFLEYDKEITYENEYLEDDYDAIIGDHEICEMRDEGRKCYICDNP